MARSVISLMRALQIPLTALSVSDVYAKHWTRMAYGFVSCSSGLIITTNIWEAGIHLYFATCLTKFKALSWKLSSCLETLAAIQLNSGCSSFPFKAPHSTMSFLPDSWMHSISSMSQAISNMTFSELFPSFFCAQISDVKRRPACKYKINGQLTMQKIEIIPDKAVWVGKMLEVWSLKYPGCCTPRARTP